MNKGKRKPFAGRTEDPEIEVAGLPIYDIRSTVAGDDAAYRALRERQAAARGMKVLWFADESSDESEPESPAQQERLDLT